MKRSRSPSAGGGDEGGEAGVAPPPAPWRSRLTEQFRALNNIIMTTRVSRKQVFVADVLEPVEKLSGTAFKMGDFTRLVAACPEAFALEWVAFSEARNRTTTVQSQRLSVAVAEHWPPGRPGSRVSVAQRLEAFRKAVECYSSEADIQTDGALPARLWEGEARVSSGDAVTAVAAQAQAEKQLDSARLHSAVSGGEGSRIDALKAAVMDRNAQRAAAAEREAAGKAQEARALRLRALPAFCDLLRMLFNRRRKTVLSTAECLRTLVAETKTGLDEYRWRIYAVCDIVPDFITIIPPDDVSPAEHIKVNVYCNYDECMKRLKMYIADHAAPTA